MTKAEYAEYLKTPHWQELKATLYARRGKRCMACDTKHRIDAHHVCYREPITDCTEYDLMPLCRTCHDITHQTTIHAESMRLEGNDARRLHVILGLQAHRATNAKPKSVQCVPKHERKRHPKNNRYFVKPPRKSKAERKRLQRTINERINAKFAPTPGSPAAIHEAKLEQLKALRRQEDHARVFGTPLASIFMPAAKTTDIGPTRPAPVIVITPPVKPYHQPKLSPAIKAERRLRRKRRKLLKALTPAMILSRHCIVRYEKLVKSCAPAPIIKISNRPTEI